jgi:hypothetical protein
VEINLPRHIINDVERRWAKKLEQAENEWKKRTKIARDYSANCYRRTMPRYSRRRQVPGWSRTENVRRR